MGCDCRINLVSLHHIAALFKQSGYERDKEIAIQRSHYWAIHWIGLEHCEQLEGDGLGRKVVDSQSQKKITARGTSVNIS
jgi:hypothetical protein